MTATQARIGIFGGTFNPIHLAHLRAAEEVVGALELERMIFVPSADPPHKVDIPGDRIASAELRPLAHRAFNGWKEHPTESLVLRPR